MKVEELRVGNLVGSAFGYKIVNTIILKNMEDGVKFTPIPITQEWLFNLGYKNYNGELYTYYGQDIEIRGDEVDFYFGEYGDWNRTIKYVHELQNLYHALTGSEINIKI